MVTKGDFNPQHMFCKISVHSFVIHGIRLSQRFGSNPLIFGTKGVFKYGDIIRFCG